MSQNRRTESGKIFLGKQKILRPHHESPTQTKSELQFSQGAASLPSVELSLYGILNHHNYFMRRVKKKRFFKEFLKFEN